MEISKEQQNCPYCNGTGWILTESNTYKKCKCIDLIENRQMWEKSGISFNDINKTFKNFEAWNIKIKEVKEIATNYFLRFENIRSERVNSILLSGNPGSGKTHLSFALANNLINKKNIQVVYMSYRDVITKLKQNMINQEVYDRELHKYKNAEVLLIDDLFKGKISETDINIIFEIVNHRYLNYLPCIISTELNRTELINLDEAIASRIIESCKDYLINIAGKENNFRLRG